MSEQSFRQQFFARLALPAPFARSRQLLQKLRQPPSEKSITVHPTHIPLTFLEKYHSDLFPDQTFSQPTNEEKIDPLKLRTTELILKQIHLYYLPNRLESLLFYCDPFTAVATFLKALNFSYETLINDYGSQQLAQDMFKEFMQIDQSYTLDKIVINEFPLYESAATHNLEHFQTTAFAMRRALDIIDILERMQPRHYEQQKDKIIYYWHQQPIQELEQIIAKLSY